MRGTGRHSTFSIVRTHARFLVPGFIVLAGLFGAPNGPLSAAEDWPALIPEELAATQSAVEPDADAEILAAEYMINDSDLSGSRIDHYFRLKVLTKAGAEKLSKVEIVYEKYRDSVSGIEVRTIKPDGTILALNPKEIFDREVVKTGDLRVRMKSFAPPGIEPGAILEYRYRLYRGRRTAMFPLTFQTDYPARSVVFRFRPVKNAPGFNLRALFLNVPPMPLKPTRAGFYEFAQTNVRSRKVEPFQPPAIHLSPSVLLYYSFAEAKTPADYWNALSERLHELTRAQTKPNKAMREEVARLLAVHDAPEEKLRKLHDYCRTAIVNLDRDLEPKPPKSPIIETAADTLKHRIGRSGDVNRLFVGLARAAGFDARLALGNDRSEFVFHPNSPVPFAFRTWLAAVRVGESWQFFDPGATYLPAGLLDWRNGDTAAIIAQEKTALIESTLSGPSSSSQRRRRATLAVLPDGSLEGDVSFEYSGYPELAEKETLDGATPDEVEKHLLAELEPHLKGAELSDIKVENARAPLAPLKVSFRLRAPDFAERTGARIFVQPNVFRRQGKALFEDAKRESVMIFPHRFQDLDEVALTLPAGATIEAGSSPMGLDLGKAGKYDVAITWSPTSRTLRLSREFVLNVIGFPRESYDSVKGLFEIIHERDNHTLSFHLPEPVSARD